MDPVECGYVQGARHHRVAALGRSCGDPCSRKAQLPEKSAANVSLADIAELCKRDLKARPARDYHEVRDQILQIAIEWDLDRDALDQQSNVCLRAVVTFLR